MIVYHRPFVELVSGNWKRNINLLNRSKKLENDSSNKYVIGLNRGNLGLICFVLGGMSYT